MKSKSLAGSAQQLLQDSTEKQEEFQAVNHYQDSRNIVNDKTSAFYKVASSPSLMSNEVLPQVDPQKTKSNSQRFNELMLETLALQSQIISLVPGLPQLTNKARSFKEVAEIVTSQLKFLYHNGLISGKPNQQQSQSLEMVQLQHQVENMLRYTEQLEQQLHEKSLQQLKLKLHTDQIMTQVRSSY